MNPEMIYELGKDTYEPVSRLKTLNQKVSIADRFLKDKIVEAFNLAKSAGQELNVTFTAAAQQLAK